jgi:hypothetical protein
VAATATKYLEIGLTVVTGILVGAEASYSSI